MNLEDAIWCLNDYKKNPLRTHFGYWDEQEDTGFEIASKDGKNFEFRFLWCYEWWENKCHSVEEYLRVYEEARRGQQ